MYIVKIPFPGPAIRNQSVCAFRTLSHTTAIDTALIRIHVGFLLFNI